MDKQNFLEHSDPEQKRYKYAKDYYLDRSFKSLLQLDVFSRISPTVEVSPSQPLGRMVDVTYEFFPTKKQEFIIEPRATNSSSILGVFAGVSYTNKNLFRSASRFKFSLLGGFESQPLVAGGGGGETGNFKFRGFNTAEWGPEITLSIPRFVPLTKKMQESTSKRAFPRTEIGTLYNFQKRTEFSRHVAEFSYKWKFTEDKRKVYTITPIRFNYVLLDKQPLFDSSLAATNDPFLINSYENFLSLGILNASFHMTNSSLRPQDKKKGDKGHIYDNLVKLTAAGLYMNAVYGLVDNLSFTQSFNTEGKELFGVAFAQYVKVEETFMFRQNINKKNKIVYRALLGAGFVYGNGISLPYTESFVAGGSNDIRAFAARTMAPGGTQAYKDTNATTTQIGDMKLEMNIEWRFKMSSLLQGAVFLDAGNIWKIQDDPSTDDDNIGVFSFASFPKQIALGTGFGIRADLDFLIIRLDMAWSLYNPYLNKGERWWLTTDMAAYNSYFDLDDKGKLIDYTAPHGLRFNFGIGYPF